MSAVDAALSFAVSSYFTPEAPAPILPKPKAKKVAKPVESTSPKAASSSPSPSPIGFVLPEKGSLEAKGFMVMMRRASSRNEKILALAAFVGYDLAGDYGSQELAALTAAKRQLNPQPIAGPTLQEKRSAQRSAMGFVAGMPNAHRVKVSDLLAREKNSAEKMVDHINLSRSASSPEERTHHAGQAALEKARLLQIRAELKSLVG